MLTCRPATTADAAALAPCLRREDVAEVFASDGWGPFQALDESVRRSDRAFAVEVGGELAALGGVERVDLLGDTGQTWLLTGYAVERAPLAFLKLIRRAVRVMLEQYRTLVSFTDARYTKAVRFFRLVGYEVGPPEPMGVAGLPFHRLTARRA